MEESKSWIERTFALIGRLIGWSVLGIICGGLLGFANGAIYEPTVDPADPLANEGYPIAVFLLMIVECMAGLLIGAGIAFSGDSGKTRLRAFALAAGGGVVGLGAGWVLTRICHLFLVQWNDGSELATNLLTQAAGVVAGLVLAARGGESD